MIHWMGGRHTELRVPKPKTGQHGRCTKAEAVDIVRQMAATYTDEEIALTLNRLGLKTGAGNTWNEVRLRSLRSYLKLPGLSGRSTRSAPQSSAGGCPIGCQPDGRVPADWTEGPPGHADCSGRSMANDASKLTSPEIVQAATALKKPDYSSRQAPADDTTLRLPGVFEEPAEDVLP